MLILMVEIVSYHPNHHKENQNIFKNIFDSISSFSPITKITLISGLLFLLVTPFFINNTQTIRQHAAYEGGPIVLQYTSGGPLPVDSNGIAYTSASTIQVQLTSSLGPPQTGSKLSAPSNLQTASFQTIVLDTFN